MQPEIALADVGVIVGRFQVHNFHPGHRELLEYVSIKHSKVIVFLGVSQVMSSRSDPLDFQARAQLFREYYPDIITLPLLDKRTDQEWSNNLDSQLATLTNPSQSVILYGSRDSFLNHYKGRHRTQMLVADPHAFWSGTEVRNKIKNTTIPSEDFRAGAIYQSFAAYPRAISTVDCAVFQGLEDLDMLVIKKPGERQWRFPGGYVNAGETYEATTRREVQEETGISITDPVYLKSFVVDDWRYRNDVDKITTSLFAAYKLSGAIKAADDASEAEWVPMKDLVEKYFMPEHRPLFECVFEWYLKQEEKKKSDPDYATHSYS